MRIPALALLSAFLMSAQDGVDSRWKGLQFLFGSWKATGGRFSFLPDLNRHIVVRRNFSDLAKHEDLLVVYTDGPEGALHGMYFDSEGHVIRYKVATPAPGRAVLDSEGAGPKYRLSYWMEQQTLKGKFEVADRTYLEWSAERIKN